MDFKNFLREVKADIEFLYPENPPLGLAYFFAAMVKHVVKKDDKLAHRVIDYLKDVTPLIRLYRDKEDILDALANFRVPDMRGKIKPKLKGLENIFEEYEKIRKKASPILKGRYRNANAKLVKLRGCFKDIPEEKLKEWRNLTPGKFATEYIDYKHKRHLHPKTLQRHIKAERKKRETQSTSKMLRELAENLSSPPKSSFQ